LQEVADNILPKFGHLVDIPRPVTELCTKRVLVMECLEGVSLMAGIKKQYSAIAAEQGKTLDQLQDEQRLKDEAAKKRGETRSVGLSSRTIRAYSWYVFSRDLVRNFGCLLYNATFGLAFPKLEYRRSTQLLDLPRILDLLWEVHGHQLLMNGCFNGDPHPGNIMLMNDGRLGLVDYGQVKRIPKENRVFIAKICLALLKDDSETVIALQKECGLETKNMDPWVIEKYARVAYDNDRREVTGGMNIQLFLEHLNERDPIVKQNDDYVMPSRMCMMLSGLSYALRYETRTCVQVNFSRLL
jgi:aarF domain-containing kinase